VSSALGSPRRRVHPAGVNPLRLRTKILVVCGGWVAAFLIGCASVAVRHWLFPLPPEVANGGMAAFGDLLQVIAVSAVVALGPLGLMLYWLRPVEQFWTSLRWSAVIFAATGWVALLVFAVGRSAPGQMNNWLLAAMARIGLMPLNALAGATCALFAPAARPRAWLVVAAFSDAVTFLGYLAVSGALASLFGL
jgi:hypothetical protein